MNVARIEALAAAHTAKYAEYTKAMNQAKLLEQEHKAIMDDLVAEGAVTAVYGRFKLTRTDKPIPKVDDWAAFHQYVWETRSFDLLHKRLTERAAMDRVEAGEILPGVSVDEKPMIKIVEL